MSSLPEGLIEKLFVRLGANYGHLFMSQFKTDQHLMAAKKEWAIALKDRSPVQLSEAIKSCQKNYMMPPTLPQFLAITDSIKISEDNTPRIPPSKTDRKKALENLADILRTIHGN
jgi:hypothetical protein